MPKVDFLCFVKKEHNIILFEWIFFCNGVAYAPKRGAGYRHSASQYETISLLGQGASGLRPFPAKIHALPI